MSVLLEIDDLAVEFSTRRGVVQAVRGASFRLEKGETLDADEGTKGNFDD